MHDFFSHVVYVVNWRYEIKLGTRYTWLCDQFSPSRKHLCSKVTPDFHLTYSKNGGNLGIKMIKSGDFQYFSIKSYGVVVF